MAHRPSHQLAWSSSSSSSATISLLHEYNNNSLIKSRYCFWIKLENASTTTFVVDAQFVFDGNRDYSFVRCCFCCIVVVFRYPIAWRCIPKKSGESFFLLLVIVMMTTTWRFSILCLKCSNLVAVWLRLPGWLAGWLAITMLVFRRTNIVSINVRGHQHSHFHHLQFHSFISLSSKSTTLVVVVHEIIPPTIHRRIRGGTHHCIREKKRLGNRTGILEMISTTENVCQQKKETTSEERVEMECMWDQKSETPYSHHRRDVAYRSNTLFVSGWTSFGSSFKLTVRHWMMELLGTIISSVVGAQPHHSTTDAAALPAASCAIT